MWIPLAALLNCYGFETTATPAAIQDRIGGSLASQEADNPSLQLEAPKNQAPFYPAEAGIHFSVVTSDANTLASTNILLKLNGNDVTPALQITGNPTNWQAAFTGLLPNQVYSAQATLVDSRGQTTSTNWTFDTYVETDVRTLEAEHYNFEGGKFINNPEFSLDEGPSNYLNKIAIESVDAHEVSAKGNHLFRPLDRVGIDLSSDQRRPMFTDGVIDDFDVTSMEQGEWLNYTRIFEAGTYEIKARLAVEGSETASAHLDEVISGSTSGLQVHVARGMFRSSLPSGSDYALVSLNDAFGSPMVLRLNGQVTLRMTADGPGLRFNYLVAAPVADPGSLPPAAVSAYPEPSSTGVMPDSPISVVIIDRDTQVRADSIRLSLNGQDLTGLTIESKGAQGTKVSYEPTTFFAYGATNHLRLIYGDTGVPSRLFTNDWSFVTVSQLPILRASQAFAPNLGRQRGFTIHTVQAKAEPLLADSIQRAEEQLAGIHTNSGVRVDTLSQALTSASLINFNVSQPDIELGRYAGDFLGDVILPGLGGHTDNVAAEVVAYLALERGTYRFGVNSDDGFRLTAGLLPADTNLVLALYDGSREAADTQFDFLAETNGLYAFRLVWEQGTGPGSIEWFSVDRQTGARTLINDTTVPGAILAYRFVNGNVVPIGFSSNPESQTVIENQPVTFAVSVTNSIPNPGNVFYQWQVDSVDIPGANLAQYVIPAVRLSDGNRKYRCMVTVPGFTSLIGAEALLTVQPDNLPPLALAAVGSPSLDTITISFSEPLDPISAQNPANYTLDGQITVNSASLDATGTNVILNTGLQAEGVRYTLTIRNVADASGLPIANDASLSFSAFSLARGYVQRELYLNIPGSSVMDLESTEKYVLGRWDSQTVLDGFQIPENIGDEYGQRISGYLIPPATGVYVFYVAADETAELRLSSDSNPLGKVTLAFVEGPTAPLEWNKFDNQASAPIHLVEGERYYIEAVHKEADGNDHLEVAWKRPGQGGDVIEQIPSQFLASYVNPDSDTTPPVLSISRFQTNILLSWPKAKSGFQLENSLVIPATNWIAVSQPATSDATNYSVTLPASGKQGFFRLKK